MTEVQHLAVPLKDIKSATANFDDNKVIRSGAFVKLYKGEITHSTGRSMVAFKILDCKFRQRDREFWKEIMLLSRYTNENLISLLGYCEEQGEEILVYELAPNGSLDRHLSCTALTWTQRIKICIEVARGICYLHYVKGTQQRLHRDIESSNILLDDNWNAKVKLEPADLDNLIFFPDDVGTIGYSDPLNLEADILTKESDVYSFGVVLFEVLCGRLCSNGRFPSLVDMWKHSYEQKRLNEIIFRDMMQQMDPKSIEIFADIAFQCLQKSCEKRPAMYAVLEMLEIALVHQETYDKHKVEEEYEAVLKAVVPPLEYNSAEDLNILLSKGLFLNEGKTWWSLDDKGEHSVMISIADCLIPDAENDYYYSFDYNSRFPLGSCSIYANKFKTRIRTQILSPLTTYNVNLVFKCRFMGSKRGYTPLKYKLKGETESSIVYLVEKRKDGWLMAELYRFTSDQRFLDLEIIFEDNMHIDWLEVDCFELHSLKKVEHEVLKYEEILKVAIPSLVYTSVEDLKAHLFKGVLLNRCKTWFSINDNGEHCEMISIAECLSPHAEKDYHYLYDYNSRFLWYTYKSPAKELKARVRTQFLSPQITYIVNLVFKIDAVDEDEENTPKQYLLRLNYKLKEESKTSVSYLADKRADGCYMVELYQFTSDKRTVDLEIIFYDHCCLLKVEGIEFKPMEKAEHHEVLEDGKVDMQPLLDTDTPYWEQKMPKDLQDIIKKSKYEVTWATKKELYYILCKGFLINNGEVWFSLDKNGNKCQMLSARAALVINKKRPNLGVFP